MEVLENIELKPYTSFFIGGPAERLLFAQSDEEIIAGLELAEQNSWPVTILGGGSNMVVNDQGVSGLVIRIETIGLDIVKENNDYVILNIASGEVWDDVVRFTVEQNWWGIENLSHIPGFSGALVVQNVGAYGQEAAQVVEKVKCFDRQTHQILELDNSDCEFGYRRSIFNSSAKDRYVILQTQIKLSKNPQPNLDYKDLAIKFLNQETNNVSIEKIRNAIIEIRNNKFPFPDQPSSGNAGSFFRGPILSEGSVR
ncbi:MAG: UDP-N-acetylmuramate dehydrogenase [Candidatus Doudnabacteria bacterium]